MEKQFVHVFPSGEKPISLTVNSVDDARQAFWERYAEMLAKELEPWARDGWRATHEIGPSCFTLRSFERPFTEKGEDENAVQSMGKAIATLFSFGLVGLTKTQFVEPAEFRVTLRKAR